MSHLTYDQRHRVAQATTTYNDLGDGLHYPRVRYGAEQRRGLLEQAEREGREVEPYEPMPRCHDCAVAVGEFHLVGCDGEECPKCGYQALSCGCGEEEHDDMDAATLIFPTDEDDMVHSIGTDERGIIPLPAWAVIHAFRKHGHTVRRTDQDWIHITFKRETEDAYAEALAIADELTP